MRGQLTVNTLNSKGGSARQHARLEKMKNDQMVNKMQIQLQLLMKK